MIFFVVCRHHEYTVQNYLESWARPLLGRVAVLNWEDCAYASRLYRGTYVLTDYERMTPAQHAFARAVTGPLEAAGCRVLNHPDRVLGRLALLQELHAARINDFDAFAADEDLSRVRLPCFVRRVSTHTGDVSELFHDVASLRRAVDERLARGEDDLIVVEYADVRDPSDGLWRKRAVLRCGGGYVARHEYVSRGWVARAAEVVDDRTVADEAAFVRSNPDLPVLTRAFELAGVDYGRIDYGLLDGRVQVWEINTNPMLTTSPFRLDPRRLPVQAQGIAQVNRLVEALDDGVPFDPATRRNWIDLNLDAELLLKVGVQPGEQALQYVGRALGRIGSAPGVRSVVEACRRARRLATAGMPYGDGPRPGGPADARRAA
jgi:hypothetical protein